MPSRLESRLTAPRSRMALATRAPNSTVLSRISCKLLISHMESYPHCLLGSRVVTSVGFISKVYSVNCLTMGAARGDGTGGKASFCLLRMSRQVLTCPSSPFTVKNSQMRTCELHYRLYNSQLTIIVASSATPPPAFSRWRTQAKTPTVRI